MKEKDEYDLKEKDEYDLKKEEIGFARLEQNITDVILETQIKLGYDNHPMQLYYPLESLKHILRVDLNVEEMNIYLRRFEKFVQPRLGLIECTESRGRYAIKIPGEGLEYVKDHVKASPFLVELINRTGMGHATMEEVLEIFRKYSDRVICKDIHSDDFDTIVYFEDGRPDDYMYCFHEEGGHLIYHRFLPEDYEEL